MKNKILMPSLLFISLMACSNEDEREQTQKELDVTVANIEGTWLANEARRNDGSELGSFEPITESNQFTYIFKNDLSVSDSFIECNGDYQLNEENKILQLFFTCIEEDIVWEVSSLEANQLILSSQVSEESFKVKFIKIKNE